LRVQLNNKVFITIAFAEAKKPEVWHD